MSHSNALKHVPQFAAIAVGCVISLGCLSASAAQYNARLSLDVPEGNTKYIAAAQFADLVSERTNGEVDIQLFPNSVLGGESESAEGIRLGSVQMGIITSSVLSSWVPEVQVLDLPYVIADEDNATALSEPLTEALSTSFAEQGFHLLGFSVNGVRQLMTNFAVEGLDDIQGKKMRVIQSPLHVEAWRSAGANPVPIPAPEVYNAMQTGVIDFFDNTATNYLTHRFYEVAPYFVKTDHMYAMGTWIVAENWWQRLPADFQQIITEAALEVQASVPEMRRQDDEAALSETVADGATIIEIEDKSPWIEAMAPVREQYAEQIPSGVELIELIQNAR